MAESKKDFVESSTDFAVESSNDWDKQDGVFRIKYVTLPPWFDSDTEAQFPCVPSLCLESVCLSSRHRIHHRQLNPCPRHLFSSRSPDPQTAREKIQVYLKLMIAALPWVGIQAIWAAEFGTTTPYLQNIGLSPQWASQIWIAGPLMGFFVAPIIGSLSDNLQSRFGRRRPFMLGGMCSNHFPTVLVRLRSFAGACQFSDSSCEWAQRYLK